MVEFPEAENLEFKWGKRRGIGGKKKDVRFYESFTYDGVEYALYDCVYLYKEEEPEPYIGKLIKIWENADKTKRIKVLWFFRPCEISNFLGNDQIFENELFLACGEGVGLANVNPLEAIAGKCNVVCISKDNRNPQPSNEDLQMCDFIFYRTFDVGHRRILDKIDEMIAGIEVKFIFNRLDCQKSGVALKLDLEKRDDNRNAVAIDEKVNLSEQKMPVKHLNEKAEGSSSDTLAKENVNTYLVKQKSSLIEKPTFSISVEPSERFKISDRQENVSSDRTTLRIKAKENALNISLVKQKSVLGEKLVSSADVENDKTITKFQKRESTSGKVSDVEVEDPSELDNRPSKKAKLDISLKVNEEKDKNDAQTLGFDYDDTITNEDKYKLKQGSHGIDKNFSQKQNGDTKFMKPTNGNLTKASSVQPSKVAKIGDNQVLEVTRRPNLDRSKWFKELPWEERMRGAHDLGTLVQLRNLDPSYTSTEVEDIIWHAFKENCSAKMVPRIFFSSPHSGQAYVIFKTREAAEMVVTKLDEGCLLLSNGRPLVATFQTPCLMGKQSTFFGHLVIDKLKFQMQRGMREAVSTSHCSQPNTLEYDMAIDWCLLQERSDRAWRKLYEQQGQELRKLKAKLKPKPK